MTIVIVPPYPQRNSPTFADEADSWNAQLPTWTDQVNATAVDVTNKQIAAAASEVAAELAETNAETAQAASEAARDLSIANASGSVATGSSIEWANKTTGIVAGGEYSAKEYAIGTTVAVGSSKDWATQTGVAVDGTEYSAKEYASGSFVPSGSAKEWSTTGEDVVVASGEYSAKHYAAKAAASVSTLPAGTINDSLTALDKTWSSTKIDTELSLVTPIENKLIITVTGNYTVPDGVTKIKVRLWGAGASGARYGDSLYLGGGGGGGGYTEKIINVTPGTVYSVIIGIGGESVTTLSSYGNNGGTTSFGTECTATGGIRGSAISSVRSDGGIGVGGDLNLIGGDGYFTDTDAYVGCTVGGQGAFGGGCVARTIIGSSNGFPGLFPGGGGTGSSTGDSGAGANGLCIVEW